MMKVQKFKSSNLESKNKVQIPKFPLADLKFKIPDLKRKYYNSKVNIFYLTLNFALTEEKSTKNFKI